MLLEFIHENIWVAKKPSAMAAALPGQLMTIIRMADGSLFIYAPFLPDELLARQIAGLGPVQAVISPNRLRYSGLASFLSQMPDCHYYCPPGMEVRIRKSSGNHRSYQLTPFSENAPWQSEIEQLHISGMPLIDESVFYHRPSKTLLTCDLLTYPEKDSGHLAALVNRFLGVRAGTLSQSRLFRSCIRNKNEYNKAIHRLQEWDFERVIISNHGGVLCEDATALIPRLKVA
ncbi:MAG: DUF4336 domain-containing protein [Deltaproteobacteria bacterium]|nr:DUF4336 domain-containing protein [Deltaproteobacteria bacterium]